MSKKSETGKTLLVAGLLCFVCSIIVSVLVVNLRPRQAKNAEIDMKKNILMSAGLVEATAKAEEIEQVFGTLETVIVDMETGEIVTDVDANSYDQVAAVKDKDYSVAIPGEKDVAGLSMRSKYAKVFVKKTETGGFDTVILSHWGKGLWSTMYGFIAIGSDLNTIKGFGYYAQGETPGLGGEVDNPSWKAQWIGKKLFDDAGNVIFKVAKGTATNPNHIDGLSGATITANGVSSSIQYWFGEHGYAKFLDKLKSGGM